MSDIPPVSGSVPVPPTTLSPQENKRLQATAAEFESLFIKQMLGAMRKTVPKSQGNEGAFLRESEGEKIFRDLLDGEYAKVMSQRKNGLGMKEALLKYLANQSGATNRDPQAEVARLQSQSNTLNLFNQQTNRASVPGGGEE
ncbi:MAG: rod-binding protein [Magnetococcales bacterium]|nr:rod-binding protein [Magnetococcales bacterium]